MPATEARPDPSQEGDVLIPLRRDVGLDGAMETVDAAPASPTHLWPKRHRPGACLGGTIGRGSRRQPRSRRTAELQSARAVRRTAGAA
jgi:hypothetical protein